MKPRTTQDGHHEGPATVENPTCRFCRTALEQLVVDLGMQPLCESFVPPDKLHAMEPFYPVKAYVCSDCFLVQVLDFVPGEDIYSYYAYFSSFSDSWLQHTRDYVEMAVERFGISGESQVVEIASNDGYLLQYMVEKGIPSLGIEPASNIAKVAVDKGINTINKFFGRETARGVVDDGVRADLLIGNNVLAHVPDLNDFVGGLKILLAPAGVITIEIPHLMRMFEGNQFDTIYQEHYSYYSLNTLERVFNAHEMTIFDVDEIPTHGGSLRIYARHAGDDRTVEPAVANLREHEIDAGYLKPQVYESFRAQVEETKRDFLLFLIQAKRDGKQVVGYGAPGKSSTLLNYCGVREDFIDYTVDRNPFKHDKFLPGTHIPIYAPEKIAETKPDYVVLLPWNLRDELTAQLDYVREWGGRFVVPIPKLTVLS